MNNWLILPLLLPLLTAILLIFLNKSVRLQRWISAFSMLLGIVIAIMIVAQVRLEGIQTLAMGGWSAPYGIVFVADMFSALMVLTTVIVAAACLFYAFGTIGEERERYYFYPLFQFLLVGVIGSFLTGDLFNLFVCFEVMLISSYALIVLGGTKKQLRETLKYMLVNILSSTLFVAAVAYLYAVVGTLNMAQLSVRVAEVGQGGILTVIAVLLLVVFSLKAGLFLFFWLPDAYEAPPAAVTALFGALLTKVGLYALIRTFTLIFSHDLEATHTLLVWMAGATMILGAIGAVAYSDVRRILNYNIVISVGFIAFGLAISSKDSLDGVVFYLMHDMIAKALLLMLGGLMISAAGTAKLSGMGGLIRRYPLLGGLFFMTGIAIAGIPPLSGFPGKLLLIRGGLSEHAYVLSAISLLSSLVVLYSLMRLFMKAFWGQEKQHHGEPHIKVPISAIALSVLVIALGIGAEWVLTFVSQAGDGLLNPAAYIEAVLKGTDR